MSSKRLYYDSIVKWKVTGTKKGMDRAANNEFDIRKATINY